MRCVPILSFALLFCFFSLRGTDARVLRILEDSGIAAPRFAEGDLDGDGVGELIVGGRVGPFRPETDPVGAKEARIEVYDPVGGGMERVAVSGNLHSVEDVAAGDLDGDGRAEIVAVGEYWIFVLEYRAGVLELEREDLLAEGRFVRVDCADLDGDGRAEAVAAELLPESGEETLASEVRLYRFDGGWREEKALRVEGHVGDLCLGDLDGDGRRELAFEQGAEEVGGQVRVCEVDGGAIRERLRQQMTADQVRALNLSAENPILGVEDVAGRIGLWRFREDRFSLVRELQVRGGFPTGLHLTHLFEGEGERLLSGVAVPLSGAGRIWLMEGGGGF